METKPTTRQGSGIRYLISGLIFLIFVIFIEYYLGWQKLLQPWQELSLISIIIAVTIVLLSYWLRALRLFFYFYAIMRGSFLSCFKLILQHNLLNNLLPMRTGELSFPVFMSRNFDIPIQKSIPALLWFRLLDVHTLVIVGLGVVVNQWVGIIPTLLLIPLIPVPYMIYLCRI